MSKSQCKRVSPEANVQAVRTQITALVWMKGRNKSPVQRDPTELPGGAKLGNFWYDCKRASKCEETSGVARGRCTAPRDQPGLQWCPGGNDNTVETVPQDLVRTPHPLRASFTTTKTNLDMMVPRACLLVVPLLRPTGSRNSHNCGRFRTAEVGRRPVCKKLQGGTECERLMDPTSRSEVDGGEAENT